MILLQKSCCVWVYCEDSVLYQKRQYRLVSHIHQVQQFVSTVTRVYMLKCQKQTDWDIGTYLSGAQFRVGFFELVPDGLEDGGEGGDSDAGAHQHADLIIEHVLAGCAKWSVHTHSEENQ